VGQRHGEALDAVALARRLAGVGAVGAVAAVGAEVPGPRREVSLHRPVVSDPPVCPPEVNSPELCVSDSPGTRVNSALKVQAVGRNSAAAPPPLTRARATIPARTRLTPMRTLRPPRWVHTVRAVMALPATPGAFRCSSARS
jgi:hypothetical protein